MARALTLFYDLVAPHALGAPAPLLDQALRHAATEFCRTTHAVNEVYTDVVTAGISDYDISVPQDLRLCSVIEVFYGVRRLTAVGVDQVRLAVALRGAVDGESPEQKDPAEYFQRDPSQATITVYPVPDRTITDGLTIRAAFEPATAATTLPDVLYDYHAQDIAHGAIAYLLQLPGQSFTNPMAAEKFAVRFNRAMDKIEAVAKHGRVQPQTRVRPRAFA